MTLIGAVALTPLITEAKTLGLFGKIAQADTLGSETLPSATSAVHNSQTIPLPTSSIGPGSIGTPRAVPPAVAQGGALVAMVGPLGSASDVGDMPTAAPDIAFYTVRAGDTISEVAGMFGITPATILSANNLKAGVPLKAGSILTILPVSGPEYTVKKGDTIEGIAKKYKADPSDLAFYNNLEDNSDLIAGDAIVVPVDSYSGDIADDAAKNAKPADKPADKPAVSKTTKPQTVASAPVVTADGLAIGNNNGKNATPITVHPMKDYDKTDLGTAILRPVALGPSRESQGAHGWNGTAVDLAAPLGTPIVAPYDATVVLARSSGYNDGYGDYVILMSTIEGQSVQFILAHMSKVEVSVGQTVSRGEEIGKVGKTGDATGYHVHFEVRGAANPLIKDPSYTGE